MPKFNRVCFNCGKEYYCCSHCISINSWKNTCCSHQCFIEMCNNTNLKIQPLPIQKGDTAMSLMKAALKSSNKTINITGYDLDLGKFDCEDGKTRGFSAFSYFIVPTSELEYFTLKTTGSKKEEVVKEVKKNTTTKVTNTEETVETSEAITTEEVTEQEVLSVKPKTQSTKKISIEKE